MSHYNSLYLRKSHKNNPMKDNSYYDDNIALRVESKSILSEKEAIQPNLVPNRRFILNPLNQQSFIKDDFTQPQSLQENSLFDPFRQQQSTQLNEGVSSVSGTLLTPKIHVMKPIRNPREQIKIKRMLKNAFKQEE